MCTGMWWGWCLLVLRWPGRDLRGSLKDEIYPACKSLWEELPGRSNPLLQGWEWVWDEIPYTYTSLVGIRRPEWWCSLSSISRLLREGSQAGEERVQEETEIHILSSLWIITTANLMAMDLRLVGDCALFSICSWISELGLSFRRAALQGTGVCKDRVFRVTTLEVKIAQVPRSHPLIHSKLSGSRVPRVTGSHGTQLGISKLGTSLWIPGRAAY